jgi:DNA-binding LacI/PurR family transcriptional regulator/DNA-binding transcriptional regulator YhcF (GntR family)
MGRPPQAIEKALTHLRATLAAGQGVAEGQRLAGIRVLSHEAGVARSTMAKAVAMLKAQGVVRTAPGTGTYAGSLEPRSYSADENVSKASAPALPPEQKWRLVAAAVRRDIASGRLAETGPIPSVKVLAGRYRADQRTIRKALHLLYREEYLRFSGRRFAVTEAPAARPGSRIVLITRAFFSPAQPFAQMTLRTRKLLEELEADFIARRIRLDYAFCTFTEQGFQIVPDIADVASGRGGLLGFIVWDYALSRELTTLVLDQLNPLGLPVAVLDEEASMGSGMPPARTVRMVSMATSSTCGRDVGRYLIRLGHRHVHFLYDTALEPWSDARLMGLREAFAECGLADGVRWTLVGPDKPQPSDPSHYTPERLVPSDLEPREREIATRAIHNIESVIWDSIVREHGAPLLHEALDRVLSVPETTAWVAVNDILGLACLEHLRTRAVSVPRKLSLVGFDDIPEALFTGLTSYSFNPRAVVRKLVDIVLTSPAVLRREARGGPVEIPGYVSERFSSGPV